MSEETQSVEEALATEAEAKAKSEARQAEMMKLQEERMEAIVIEARKILPFVTEANRTVDKTKIMLETLAVTLQQGVYNLMRENKVSALKLKEKIDVSYPDYEVYLPILDLVDDLPLDLAVECLQWLSEKIKAVQKEEDKKREFISLGIDF